ncbi:MAG: hypothetical protein ACPGO3_05980 [Magnetospiraceae bacterium]
MYDGQSTPGGMFKLLRQHISTLAGDGGIPQREQVYLPDLHEIAPHILLIGVERSASGYRFVLRFFGTGLSALVGMNPMGMYVDQLTHLSNIQGISNHYRRIVETGEEHILQQEVEVAENKSTGRRRVTLHIHELGLPLLGPGGEIDFIIGVVEVKKDFLPRRRQIP